ncbi:MAG: hypothetical protein GX087_10000 [Desulfobulbaceae bacterium]|nr:hypothetical protein [Desulfobulbaceae bacterium]
MPKAIYEAGLQRLRHPVRPLLYIVEFILHTGAFACAQEVLDMLPETIETERATYKGARQYLQPYLPELEQFCSPQAEGNDALPLVLDPDGEPLSTTETLAALLGQRVLEKELEQINSLLCGAHNCTLCCTGPEASMRQQYFDIPLHSGEETLFALEKPVKSGHGDTTLHTLETIAAGLDASCSDAVLVRHLQGYSLILPRHAHCPALDSAGRCSIYKKRPQVCRKPQIFSYLLEQEKVDGADESKMIFRLRNILLAVMDCPYVQALQDDIALYAAASELELIFRHNKA